MACYGREILENVAKESDLSVEQIERYEESVTNSLLYTVFVMSKAQSGDTDMLTEEGHVYLAEQAAIKRLALNGPAVFLGHCASEALCPEGACTGINCIRDRYLTFTGTLGMIRSVYTTDGSGIDHRKYRCCECRPSGRTGSAAGCFYQAGK